MAEFITLLRECAPEKELQAAADKIYADRRASEDINRHTVELATAFRTFVENSGLSQAASALKASRGFTR